MKNRGKKTHTSYSQPLTGSVGGGYAGFDCSRVNINTKLKNIQVGFDKVKEDSLLQIKLTNINELGVYNHDGEICGYIASPYNKDLINCINQGNKYWAKVLSISGDIQIEN